MGANQHKIRRAVAINNPPENDLPFSVGGTSGQLMAKGTTAQRPVSAIVGTYRFNTDLDTVEWRNSFGWDHAQALNPSETIVEIERYGAVGDGTTNDYPAFRLAALDPDVRVIILDSKTYNLDNSIGTIAEQLAGMAMFAGKFIIGRSGSVIRFSSIVTPLFTFYDSPFGGVSNVDFIFTGTTPTMSSQHPSKSAFMAKLGVTTLSGGAQLEIGPLYMFNSERSTLTDLRFRSATPGDPTKCMGIVITFRAKEDIPRYNYGTTIRNISFAHCQNGILFCSQRDFVIQTIRCAERVGLAYYPPGHAIYFSANNGITENTGICTDVIDFGRNITGPGTVDTQNIATLSCKYMRNCSVSNVTSYHPEGLIQSFDNANGNSFDNFTWYYDGETVGSPLNFVAPSNKPCENNIFTNFKFIVPNTFTYIATTSQLQTLFNRNIFKNFYFKMQPNYNTGQVVSNGVFDFYGNGNYVDATIELTEAVNTTGYNTALVNRGTSGNNTFDVKVIGPNMDQRFIRALGAAGVNNRFNWDVPPNANGQMYGTKVPSGSYQTFKDLQDRFASGIGNATGVGLTAELIVLPGPGAYQVTATVSNTTETAGVTAIYDLIWSPVGKGNFGVAASMGAPLPFGTGYSNLVLSIDNTGIVTATFDKVPTGASRCNGTWKYISGIGSNL